MNDKSREHVGVVLKPTSVVDPNAAQPNLLLGHSFSVVSVQLLPVFILQ